MRASSFKQMVVLLGRRIHDLREKQGMSQEQVAEQVGISRTYLAYLETGTRTPSLKILAKLATVLAVSLKELFAF